METNYIQIGSCLPKTQKQTLEMRSFSMKLTCVHAHIRKIKYHTSRHYFEIPDIFKFPRRKKFNFSYFIQRMA